MINVYTSINVLLFSVAAIVACQPANGPKHDWPDQGEALEMYQRQPHRFELRHCKLFYNARQVMLYETLPVFERTFGRNYHEQGDDLYFRDVPVSLKVEAGMVTHISIWLSLPDNIDEPSSLMHFMRDDLKHQKLLEGYMMIDSVMLDAHTAVTAINEALRNRGHLDQITSRFGDHKYLGYRFYYPELDACTPLPNLAVPSATFVAIIREDSNNLREIRYSYSFGDHFSQNEVVTY